VTEIGLHANESSDSLSLLFQHLSLYAIQWSKYRLKLKKLLVHETYRHGPALFKIQCS